MLWNFIKKWPAKIASHLFLKNFCLGYICIFCYRGYSFGGSGTATTAS